MLSVLNRSLIARPIDAQYLAMTYVIWDDERRQARVANSGLPRAVYCHNAKVQMVEAAGLPVGMFPSPEYDEVTFNASEGDVFIFFTDGITDATNAHGHMFGRTRIEQLVATHCDRTADEIVTAIFKAVAEYTAGTEPFDDQTVVAIKVRKAVVSKSTKK
jgi:sigma-B regulation protein RsbU (phosphoserine phosphatase)